MYITFIMTLLVAGFFYSLMGNGGGNAGRLSEDTDREQEAQLYDHR